MDTAPSKKVTSTANDDLAEKISKKEDVQSIIQQYKRLIAEGMEYFQRFDSQSELSSILPKLLNFNPVNQFFGADKLSNRDYLSLVNVAMNVYWDGDFASAKIMFNLLINLFPLNVQAHIFLAEIEGQERGIDAAVYYYEKLIGKLRHPLLYVHAAECLMQTERTKEAHELLVDALWMCSEEPEAFSPLAKEIEEHLKNLG